MSGRRIVAVGALASAAALVRVPAARVRLKAIKAQSSQAALAVKTPEGRWDRAEALRSAWTFSMIACRRWVWSAAIVSRTSGSVGVKKAWKRQVWNSASCPGLGWGLGPGVEQRLLPGALLGVELGDAAHDEPAADLLALLLRGERGEGDLGDLRLGDPGAGGLVEDRVGVLDRGPHGLGDAGDRAFDRGVHSDGDRHLGPGMARRGDQGVGVERRVRPQQHVPPGQLRAADQGEGVGG